ncbi:glycoside hydrolase, family 1 protein [Listeria monocytogenes SLCC7179]|uniref:glycoside hydrolase family 1 protein n=1 Tax=Listeria monocytogenes TaxID=1639 RepID=UPI00027E8574|nr:glycoside hydrolase family 1 protein [Listeria monocytogenes]CBY59924.1 glycoside hydrolase, family 1 protein [Listeria monocytogenes SLCC7179]
MFNLQKGFPENFKWGSSTNAQQFEGGYKEGGKGLSIADVRVIPDMPDESDFESFKMASDHYHHYKEDIAYYGEMGFQIYRFTMAWSRIFPNGDETEPNDAGVEFYSNMLAELEKYNIEPVVTLYAYDMPLQLLEKYNGWLDRAIIKDYLHYVETVVKLFKGRVKYWVPFNEQNFISIDSEYMSGYRAKNKAEVFQIQHHFNLCYAEATKLVHQIDPDAKVGGNIGNICPYPMTCKPEDVEASDKVAQQLGYAYGDIYFRGYYPKYFLKEYEGVDFEQIILDDDLTIIKSSEPDFMSLTYYMSSAIEAKGEEEVVVMNGIKAPNPYCETTEWGWTIDPYGFKHYLQEFYHRYQLPILILENGMGARDEKNTDDTIDDTYRIDYLASHIARMQEAVEEGCEIIGYLTWSATDLYSTREGFEKRYGFVYVDKDNSYKRLKKKSFYWYKKVIETNGNDLNY